MMELFFIVDRVNYNAGKCIPITRGAGIYQDHMNEALDYLGKGHWVNLDI